MKKILLVTLVIALSFSLAGIAMAVVKPPKKICLLWLGSSFNTVLFIKSFGGNIPISGGKIKFYGIHGEVTNQGDFSAPVSGTGHMDGDIFHFSLTGSSLWTDGRLWSFHFEGFWDVVNETGTGSYQGIVRNAGTGNAEITDFNFAITLQAGDCLITVIPYSPDSNLESTDRLPSEGP